MNADASGSLIFAAIIVGIVLVNRLDPVDSFKADEMGCAETYKNSDRCAQKGVFAFWKISVNKAAGTCAMLLRDRKTDSSTFYPGTSLVYIDSKNWLCEQRPAQSGSGRRAEMDNGTLSIEFTNWDSISGNEVKSEDDIEIADGWTGTPLHYWRLLEAKLRDWGG